MSVRQRHGVLKEASGSVDVWDHPDGKFVGIRVFQDGRAELAWLTFEEAEYFAGEIYSAIRRMKEITNAG